MVRSETPPPQAWVKMLSRPPGQSGVGRVHPLSQAGRCEESPGRGRGSRAFPSGSASALCAAGSQPTEPRESHCPRLWKSLPLRLIPLMARGPREIAPVQEKLPNPVCSMVQCVRPSGVPGHLDPMGPRLDPKDSAIATRTSLALCAQKRATARKAQPPLRFSLQLPPPTQEVSVLLEQ